MNLNVSRPRTAGFGLLEAMIMVAVSGVVITGVSSLLSINNYQIRLVNFKTQRDALAQALGGQMADPSICSAGVNHALPFTADDQGRIQLGFQALGSPQVFSAGSVPAPNMVVRGLYLTNLRPTNLVGFNKGLMQAGDLYLDLQSTTSGLPALPPIALGNLYVEPQGGQVGSCFNNVGFFGASIMACLQISGNLSAKDTNCDLTAFRKSVQQTIYDQVHSELYGIYDAWIMGNTDGILATAAPATLSATIAQANANSDQSKNQQQAVITQTYNGLNQSVNSSNQNMTYEINNLWAGVNAANQTANAANQTANAANGYAGAAQATANAANAAAYGAQQAAIYAQGVAGGALATANDANGAANGALGTAGNAANTAAWANQVAWNAYGVAAAANSTANAAYGAASSAYNTANAANAYGYAAYNSAGGLLDYSNSVNANAFYDITVAHSANVYAQGSYGGATWALGMAQQAYNTPPQQVNQWSTSYDCGPMLGTGIQCP